jgi:hypothetical protein
MSQWDFVKNKLDVICSICKTVHNSGADPYLRGRHHMHRRIDGR